MIELSRQFVCAADEVWRLQRGSDADCVFFQRMVNGGKRITDRGSRQGTWICAPSGRLLARVNSRDLDKVVATLERGLAAWDELDDEARRLAPGAELTPAHRWEHSYPEDGLVLERMGRELTDDSPQGAPQSRWNRDFAWFSKGEIEGQVPADAVAGDSFELPLIVRRLGRFHLTDNVRGQTTPFADGELREARLTARVTRREGGTLELELAGSTWAVADEKWLMGDNLWKPRTVHSHTLRTEIRGLASYDLEARAFVAFEMIAIGDRTGRTEFNGRGRDDSPGRIGFHFSLAKDGIRVAPTFVAVYGAPWIRQPEVPTWLQSPAECGLEDG